jgi:predicted LPLAT superfamily acyltransferase
MSNSDPETGRWSQIAERGSLWGMRFTAWAYRTVGRRPAEALIHLIVTYFFLTDRSGRRASLAYLRRVYATLEGKRRLGRPPGLWQSFLHYRAFGLSIGDRLAIWLGRSDDLVFDIEAEEYLDHITESGRGAILVGAHLGSFDALRALAVRKKSAVNVVMFTNHAQRINTLFRELSPEVDTRVISIRAGSIDSVFEIRACIERGELVAILGDRMEPGDHGHSSRVSILGDWVELPLAPYLLANLLRCPVLMLIAVREAPGRYSVFCQELAEPARLPRGEREKWASELLAAYAGRLEHFATRYPYQWFNFFDYWGDDK